MKRVLKWFLPALVVAEIALVWGHVLDAGTALLVGGGIELLLLRRGRRRDRVDGARLPA